MLPPLLCGGPILLKVVVKYFYAVLSQIHFCCNLRTYSGKIVLAQSLLVYKKNFSFSMSVCADSSTDTKNKQKKTLFFVYFSHVMCPVSGL